MKTVFVNTPAGVKEVKLTQIREVVIERKINYPGWQIFIEGRHYQDFLEEPLINAEEEKYPAENIIHPDVELFIHSSNPLSNQLKKITGDTYNSFDFENLFRAALIHHMKTGLIIRTHSEESMRLLLSFSS